MEKGRQDRPGSGAGGFSGFSHGTQSEWSHLPPPAAAEAAIHANELVCAAATLAFIHLQKSRIRHERPQGRKAANTLNSAARHGTAWRAGKERVLRALTTAITTTTTHLLARHRAAQGRGNGVRGAWGGWSRELTMTRQRC